MQMSMHRRRCGRGWVAAVFLLLVQSAQAQTPVKNPAALAFTCPDHATDDQHEIDIVRVSDGVVVATILGGDPPLQNNEVIIPINVQPVAFGSYRFIVRAVAGSVKSVNSVPSEIWDRVPGQPSQPVAR